MKKTNCKKALFLDRDGVINLDTGYVSNVKDFLFVDGIFDIAGFFKKLGFDIFVITNQAGIGKEFYSIDAFLSLSEWMRKQFQERNIKISEVYFCPYHPDSTKKKYQLRHFDRKPKPGMILKACKKHNIDLGKSFLIGDKKTDIIAGRLSGVGTNILYNNVFQNILPLYDKKLKCYMVSNLYSVKMIISLNRKKK